VVNVHDIVSWRLDLKRGNRTGGPLRLPDFESRHASRPRTRLRIPDEYASFELSAHHGATSALTSFQRLRSDGSDHETNGVSWSPDRP
jgi:hypothetical protein